MNPEQLQMHLQQPLTTLSSSHSGAIDLSIQPDLRKVKTSMEEDKNRGNDLMSKDAGNVTQDEMQESSIMAVLHSQRGVRTRKKQLDSLNSSINKKSASHLSLN